MTTAVVNTKIGEVENKTPDNSGLATTAVLNTKFSEVEQNRLMIVSTYAVCGKKKSRFIKNQKVH